MEIICYKRQGLRLFLDRRAMELISGDPMPFATGFTVARVPEPTKLRADRRKSGFSLIELLVVLAILSVLVTVGVSTLSAPKQGLDITMAGGMLGDLAGLSRQHALSKNTWTVLVVAQVSDGAISRSAASIWDAATTNQLEKWNFLPESVIATNSSISPGATFGGARYRGQSVANPATYWFYPDGRMGDDPSLVPKLTVRPRQGPAGNVCELVFNPTTGTFKANRP